MTSMEKMAAFGCEGYISQHLFFMCSFWEKLPSAEFFNTEQLQKSKEKENLSQVSEFTADLAGS